MKIKQEWKDTHNWLDDLWFCEVKLYKSSNVEFNLNVNFNTNSNDDQIYFQMKSIPIKSTNVIQCWKFKMLVPKSISEKNISLPKIKDDKNTTKNGNKSQR